MTWFPDLSSYEYRPGFRARNIGWLGEGHSFEVSAPDESLLALLWEVCGILVFETRGLHTCHLCRASANSADGRLIGNVNSHGSESMLLGSAEAWFVCDGEIFAAPNLIYHYADCHSYRPPDVFLAAVSRCRFEREQHLRVLTDLGLPCRSAPLNGAPRVVVPSDSAG